MKPQENPEELYFEAIKREQKNVQDLDVPIKLKHTTSKRNLRVFSVAAGIAAIALFVWFLSFPPNNADKAYLTQTNIANTFDTPDFIDQQGKIKTMERFNSNIKSLKKANNTIDTFNKKINKFSKSNT